MESTQKLVLTSCHPTRSNNTFAIFVHFQVTFTLACTLLLRSDEEFNNQNRDSFQIDSTSLSYALLISNASVLLFGLILIGRACINTSEGDLLDAGFDDEIFYHDENQKENDEKEEVEMVNPLFFQDMS